MASLLLHAVARIRSTLFFGRFDAYPDFIIAPSPWRFPRDQITQRSVVSLRAAEVAGFPALRTVTATCVRSAAASFLDIAAFIPTNATAIAPAVATATILKWAARLAPSLEWVISVSSVSVWHLPQGRSDEGYPDSEAEIFQTRRAGRSLQPI